MTVYDQIVYVVCGFLILTGVIWLLCYKLDKWLEIKETQRRGRAICDEHRKACLYQGIGPNKTICHHCESMASVVTKKEIP